MVVLACGIGLNASLGGGASAQDGGATTAQVEQGRDLYSSQCVNCHGRDGRGRADLGVPPLQGVGAAAVDFYIRTGRMPIDDVNDAIRHGPQKLSDEAKRALIAYITTFPGRGPAIPDVEGWQQADVSRGLELFNGNCAACHGPTGAGIAVGQEDIAPSLDRATPLEVAEAVRIGPGVMPVFGDDVYTPDDVEAVVKWVMRLRERPAPGGTQVGRSGPVTEGFVAWGLGMGLLGIVMYLLGEKASEDA